MIGCWWGGRGVLTTFIMSAERLTEAEMAALLLYDLDPAT